MKERQSSSIIRQINEKKMQDFIIVLSSITLMCLVRWTEIWGIKRMKKSSNLLVWLERRDKGGKPHPPGLIKFHSSISSFDPLK